ncbi:MAG: PTS fructose transporter subunit IIA [Porticoccaceae bacterium]|nr:PTS fructose transporter subunit IIA [Porticoccaceae bacterium]|tara:strand:+ start:19216 stop:19683 length:468 start_codon:yes stop_codon:yes gene_type:complete
MEISDVLIPELAMCDLNGYSKKKVLENIAQFITKELGADQEQAFALFRSMLARERLGSTGIGKGVAIPHCKVMGLKEVHGCLIKLNISIDFDAFDEQPVDLIFALVVPHEKNDEHLETLSKIAQMFHKESSRRQLRECNNNRQLFDTAILLDRTG